MVDLTEPASDQRCSSAPRGGGRDGRPHRLLHEPAARHGLRARAGVDRHPATCWPPRAAAGVKHAGDALVHRRLRRARAEPELPDRGPPAAARTRARLGARQAGGRAARGLASRGAIPSWRSRSCASRRCSGPGVHTFYTRLFDQRVVPVRDGLRPAGAAPAPGRRARRVRAGAASGAPAGVFNVVPRATITLLTALPPGGQGPGAGAAPRWRTRSADLLWAAGLGEAPGGFVDYVRYLFVADGEKARASWASSARHRSREALDRLPGVPLPEVERRTPKPERSGEPRRARRA